MTVSPNSGADSSNNSDANASGFITNIHLTANDLDEDIGIYSTIVKSTTIQADTNCSCSDYTESSVSIFSNLLTLIFLIVTTSMLGIFFIKRESFSL